MSLLRRAAGYFGAALGVFLMACIGLLGFRLLLPAPEIAPPSGPCVEVMVASNGFHTDLIFPAAILPTDHPLRRLFPRARTLAVGWGDREAYRSGAQRPWLHLMTMIPPRPSVMHVAADTGWAGRRAAISARGAAQLALHLRDALTPTRGGDATIVSSGQIPGRSYFLAAREHFHIFNLCNHWTARTLNAAGLPVTDLGAWTADAVTHQIARAPTCAAPRRIGAEALP